MKKIFKEKKFVFIGIGAVLLIILVVAITLNLNSQEKKLTMKINEMASNFYENFYYDQLGTDSEREAYLKKYEKIGFKINLDNLSRYKGGNSEEILKEFVNKKTGKKCDIYQTQATIYPQESYGKNDYKIEVKLECGF